MEKRGNKDCIIAAVQLPCDGPLPYLRNSPTEFSLVIMATGRESTNGCFLPHLSRRVFIFFLYINCHDNVSYQPFKTCLLSNQIMSKFVWSEQKLDDITLAMSSAISSPLSQFGGRSLTSFITDGFLVSIGIFHHFPNRHLAQHSTGTGQCARTRVPVWAGA